MKQSKKTSIADLFNRDTNKSSPPFTKDVQQSKNTSSADLFNSDTNKSSNEIITSTTEDTDNENVKHYDNEPNNISIKINMHSRDFLKESLNNRDGCVRPNSPLIVPCVTQLHKLLCQKFLESDSIIEKFIQRNSVMEIAKLLKIFHKDYGTIKLNDNTYFYPCKQCLQTEISGCHDFTVLSKSYNRDVLCDSCNLYIKNIKRNQKSCDGKSNTKEPVQQPFIN